MSLMSIRESTVALTWLRCRSLTRQNINTLQTVGS